MTPPPSRLQPLLRNSLRLFRWHKLLPTTLWGDRLYAHLLCLLHNGHWPRSQNGGYRDFLTHLKCSPEIESPLRQQLTDKVTAQEVIAQRLGIQWCIPILDILENPTQLATFPFPQRCIIKASHASGLVLRRLNGEPLDPKILKRWFGMNHYLKGRERNYRHLPARLIVQPLLPLDDGVEYLLHCVRGEPRELTVLDASTRMALMTFDMRGSPVVPSRPRSPAEGERWNRLATAPPFLDELIGACRSLTRGLLYARVDFLRSGGQLYVVEVTSVPVNAVGQPSPEVDQARTLRWFGGKRFNLVDFPELARR
jgi:hypothetical protein